MYKYADKFLLIATLVEFDTELNFLSDGIIFMGIYSKKSTV